LHDTNKYYIHDEVQINRISTCTYLAHFQFILPGNNQKISELGTTKQKLHFLQNYFADLALFLNMIF